MQPYKSRSAPPKASAMLESLRGLGYSPATALADIIDNSLSARADLVEIAFVWSGDGSTISVVDNGTGMSDSELESAMRLGDKNPEDVRALHDLGRFGLGLKTASFSQCRRLTVASKKDDIVSCLRWDLEFLAKQDDSTWQLLEGCAPEAERHLKILDEFEAGTVVLWEAMDRIVVPGFQEQDFLNLIDTVEMHLGVVFHRYLTDIDSRFNLKINGRKVTPWDPFLIGQPSTWSSPIERIPSNIGFVEVQCHVLPHKDRLDQRTLELAAGPDGWTAQQGFYVYRNRRLVVCGSWLGLGRGRPWTKDEAHRLARIRLDILNTEDASWKIDVRKSIARPPVALRERLTRLAEDTRFRARHVFAHRGQVVSAGDRQVQVHVWQAKHGKDGIRYNIDVEHPAIKHLLEDAGTLEPRIRGLLRIIEDTIPVRQIWLDTAENREASEASIAPELIPEHLMILHAVYRNLVYRKGYTPIAAREHLRCIEPFSSFPELVSRIPDSLDEE